jgi:ABC-2 type transport system permease protein
MQKDMSGTFIKKIPSPIDAFRSLLRADFAVQWRQRRALIMSLITPVIFLLAWKSLIPEIGAAGVLSICVAIGLPGTGLMGYSMTLARDRERGIFQRLRAAPIPTWVIMMSRIVVQLSMIMLMALVTCAVAYFADHIVIGAANILLILVASAIGGLAFLALGQAIVAFMRSSDAINATTRLLYMVIAVVGGLGQVGLFGAALQKIVTYSPLGTSKTMIVAAMSPSTIFTQPVLLAVGITLAYGVFFAVIGIRSFKWTVN